MILRTAKQARGYILTLSLKAREFLLIPVLITGADEIVPIAPTPRPGGPVEEADETTRVGRVPLPLRRRTTCEWVEFLESRGMQTRPMDLIYSETCIPRSHSLLGPLGHIPIMAMPCTLTSDHLSIKPGP